MPIMKGYTMGKICHNVKIFRFNFGLSVKLSGKA